MPEIKSLALPTVTGENLPRNKMLEWVNTTLSAKYKKIEELCSGVAYCQLMEKIFPNSIGMRKVKMNAKLEHDFIHNLKLFQSAFLKMNFDKNVPIDKLVKGRFQDNFEFLQWFKKFYDMYSNDKENAKAVTNASMTLSAGKPIRKASSATNLKANAVSPVGSFGSVKKTTPTSAPGASSMRKKSSSTSHLTPRSSQPSEPISPSSVEVLTETCNELKAQITVTKDDKDYYFEKLRQIENLCLECQKQNEYPEWTTKLLGILYETKESEQASPPNF